MPEHLRSWCQSGSPERGEEESVQGVMVTGVHGKEWWARQYFDFFWLC